MIMIICTPITLQSSVGDGLVVDIVNVAGWEPDGEPVLETPSVRELGTECEIGDVRLDPGRGNEVGVTLGMELEFEISERLLDVEDTRVLKPELDSGISTIEVSLGIDDVTDIGVDSGPEDSGHSVVVTVVSRVVFIVLSKLTEGIEDVCAE